MEQQWPKALRGKNVKLFRLGIDHVSIRAFHVWAVDEVEMIWKEDNVV
jgi:hypothetical protein